jgi:zinc protease
VPFPDRQAAATGVDRAKRPEPAAVPVPAFPAFSRQKLSNGLTVLVAERHAVPDVQLDLLVDAGYASDQLGAPGEAKLAAAMLDEGTRTRSALAISDQLQRLGARLETSSNLDTSVVSMSALRANLEPSLALLADVVLNPVFPEADFARLKAQQLATLQQEAVQPVTAAQRILPRLLFGEGHAYATPLTGSGTTAAVEKLTRADAARWHQTWVRPNNATLVVVGDTTAREIVPRLERLLGGWRPAEVPRKNLAPVPPPAGARVYLLDRPGSIQTVVVAGQLAPPRANPQEIAQTAMNTVLGGAFTSRLNMNLREDKHWSYGARSSLFDARGPRPFFALAPVQADKTKETVVELRKELQGIRGARGITADEVAMARGTLTLALPGRWETSRAVAASIAQIVRFGFDDRYFDAYPGKVQALTAKDLASAAELVDPDRLTWVIVGDRARIEPGLRELKLGEIRLVDADGNEKKPASAGR